MQAVDPRLVTPEAVVLHFDTAGLGSRFLARMVDLMIQVAAVILLLFAVGAGANGGVGSTPLTIFLLVGVFAVIFVYPALMESLWRGRTVGKAALGVRVVTREGAPVRFRHAAIRSALFVVDCLIFGPVIGVLCLLISRDNQRLGDVAAGTLVVRERSGAQAPTPVYFGPMPGYEAYIASLDTTGLSAQEYEVVRSMLVRGPSLPPDVRYRLSHRLATYIVQRMHHTPPPGLAPEAFLACVAASYQARSAPLSPWSPGGWGAPVPAPPGSTVPQAPPAPPLPLPPSAPPPAAEGGFVAPS